MMAEKIKFPAIPDFQDRVNFRPQIGAEDTVFHFAIWHDVLDNVIVVLYENPGENRGKSLTNAIQEAAGIVQVRYGFDPNKVVWFQYEPEYGDYDTVTFTFNPKQPLLWSNRVLPKRLLASPFSQPQWQSSSRENFHDAVRGLKGIKVSGLNLKNKSMQRKLENGECIDVSPFERTPNGYYILPYFAEGSDYCDAEREVWIWSIGRHRETMQILASTDSVFYQNPLYECLFLR